MKKAVNGLIGVIFAVLLTAAAANAQVSINLAVFPNLVPIPDYPVYYVPSLHANYFFYDGQYWVFNVNDGFWYSSTWYNGPWVYVEPAFVPQPILVVPYRYYGFRPVYWSGWVLDAPPRWGVHWGHDWEVRRVGWDHWDRHRYVIAPLPLYQRNYPRDRYPSLSQQVIIHKDNYKYVVKDSLVRDHHNDIIRAQERGGLKANDKAERVSFKGGGDEGKKNFQGGGGDRQEKALRREKSPQGQGQGQGQGPQQGMRRQQNVQGQGQQGQGQGQGQGSQHDERMRRQQNAQFEGQGQGQGQGQGPQQRGQGNPQQPRGQHQGGQQKGGREHEKGER